MIASAFYALCKSYDLNVPLSYYQNAVAQKKVHNIAKLIKI